MASSGTSDRSPLGKAGDLRLLAGILRRPPFTFLDLTFAAVLDTAAEAFEAPLADPFLDREVLHRLAEFAARAFAVPEEN